MNESTAERVLSLLAATPEITTVDITGGAPELNANFHALVTQSRRLDKHVIDRCNLTILLEQGFEGLADFLCANQVHIVASLPCYTAGNVDKQRGRGVFDRSIRALQQLNRFGYGTVSELTLDLVFNPVGHSLPPDQHILEADYKQHLRDEFGIEFNRLLTITNMPISRFSDQLVRIGKLDYYMHLLENSFNPKTIEQLMCRTLVSVSWDGFLYDCDFNQMLDLPVAAQASIWEIESFASLSNQQIRTGSHCFGCTAGAGSSCGGQLQ